MKEMSVLPERIGLGAIPYYGARSDGEIRVEQRIVKLERSGLCCTIEGGVSRRLHIQEITDAEGLLLADSGLAVREIPALFKPLFLMIMAAEEAELGGVNTLRTKHIVCQMVHAVYELQEALPGEDPDAMAAADSVTREDDIAVDQIETH